jgi:hypothetical protein
VLYAVAQSVERGKRQPGRKQEGFASLRLR